MESSVVVSTEDENVHAPGPDPNWSESFYLNFADPTGTLGGFARLAVHPSKKISQAIICVYLPEGGFAITRIERGIDASGSTVRVGEEAIWECVKPLESVRLAFRGDLSVFKNSGEVLRFFEPGATPPPIRKVALDLTAVGVYAPFEYPPYRKVATSPPHKGQPLTFSAKLKRARRWFAEVRSALNMRGGRHYEQSIHVQGSITIDGREFPFEGTGHRDHSFGIRDWMPAHRWRWLSAEIGDFSFNAMYMTMAGTHVINGYVWHDGRCDVVEGIEMECSYDETGIAGRDVCVVLKAGGREFMVTGTVLLNVPMPIVGPDSKHMYTVGRAHYRYGDRTGYGVAEFLERVSP